MKRTKQRTGAAAPCRRHAAKTPLLMIGLALLCLLGLAGCGRASRLVGPRQPEANTRPAKGKASWPPLGTNCGTFPTTAALSMHCRATGIPRHYRAKATAVFFGSDATFLERAIKLLQRRQRFDPDFRLVELGLFDMAQDGFPELMLIYHSGYGGRSEFTLYDLSEREPVFLGYHIWPWSSRRKEVYARQTESGWAWRIDSDTTPSSGNNYTETISELFLPCKDGLEVWECIEDELHDIMVPTYSTQLTYSVYHSLWQEGQRFFDRREEKLSFLPDVLLEYRAGEDQEGRPLEEQLQENEYPVREMEVRLASSLYRQLLRGWTRIPDPWLRESELYPDGEFWQFQDNEIEVRVRLLYEAWQEQQAG